MQTLRLGDILVQQGVLTITQRDQVLAAQRLRGGAFGALAEDMYGVGSDVVERAWAEQYASYVPRVDPRTMEIGAEVLELVHRRQAWQFRLMPLERRGGALICCTTKNHLARALRFAGWKLGHDVQFVLAEGAALGEAMARRYPMAGMNALVFQGDGFAAV